nr:hypothetical protein [Tanacetum cinerariifolium]
MVKQDTNQPLPPPIAPPEAPQMVSSMTKDEAGNEVEVPPVTAHQILLRTRERKAKGTLLMAIPDENLTRIYRIKDAKTLWAAIKTRFGDNLDIDDLYNNLKVYEDDIKGSSGSSSNSQNVPFVFTKSTSITNELNADYSVSTEIGHSSQAEGSSSYAYELMFSFFANPSSNPRLDNVDLDQIDQDDLEEMDLKWQVTMLFIRVKRFYKKTRRKLKFNGKEPVGFNKIKVECFNCHRRGHFARDCRTARNPGNKGRMLGMSGTEEEIMVKGLWGFHAVPHPLTWNYMPPKPGLSFAGLDDSIYKFKISETVTSLSKDVKDSPKTSTAFEEKPKEVRTNAPLIQGWDTDSDNDSVFRPKHIPAKINFVKAGESVKPVKSVKHVKPVKPVKTAEQTEKSKNFVFTRSGRIQVNAAKPKAAVSTSAAKPVNIAGPKQSVNFSNSRSTFHKSHSPIRRSFYNVTAHSRSKSTERFNTAGSKAVSAVNGNLGYPQQALKNKGIVDSGCSRHMTKNKGYLADYQEINDGSFVAFGSSRGKIIGKCKIRTEKLDFDHVYFVTELKFNLFSVSQMYDKKNSILFTETEC